MSIAWWSVDGTDGHCWDHTATRQCGGRPELLQTWDVRILTRCSYRTGRALFGSSTFLLQALGLSSRRSGAATMLRSAHGFAPLGQSSLTPKRSSRSHG